MKIFRKPSKSESTGDAIPFFHDGTYHIFSLTPPQGTTVYPARLRTSWSHTVSKDLVNWTELETALVPGEGSEPDADGVWTGSVIYGEGQYHIFYTGYNYHIEDQQTICHAVSDDGIHWTKDKNNPVIKAKTDLYERLDWRDPYVFYNEEDKKYWILISARSKHGPLTKTGCIVLYRSDDLEKWEYYGPIYQPFHTNCPECCEMYKIGDRWYLSYSRFSEFVNTIYRTAPTSFGPWKTPRMDGIGGRRFYAAKSLVNDEGRRFYFAWAHDRADRSDYGEWYWGGEFCVPHEVVQNSEGELDVKLPKEYVEAFNNPVKWSYAHEFGDNQKIHDNSIKLNALQTFSYGFFTVDKPSFLFSCKVAPEETNESFGLILKSDRNTAQCLELLFETGMQRVSLVNLPMDVDPFWRQSCSNVGKPKDPGPDGVRVAEKPLAFKSGDVLDLKVIIDNEMIEIFVNEQVAFTYRFYQKTEYEIGLFSRDSIVTFDDIKFTE